MFMHIFPFRAEGKTLLAPFTWNAALGMEWYLSPYFPLRLGVFTNNANTKKILETDRNQEENVDLYGGSISIGYTTSDYSINIGFSGSVGAGKAQIVWDGETQGLEVFSASLFISGGYQF